MMRKFNGNCSLNSFAALIAILILSIAPAVLAQVKGTNASSGKRQALTDASGVVKSGHSASLPSQRKAVGGRALDLQDPIFVAPVTYILGGAGNPSVAIADLNGDGQPDVVASNVWTTNCCSGVVSVLLGNRDGSFQPEVTFDSGGDSALSVAVGDVNGDGKPDILVSNQCDHYYACSFGPVAVFLGNGDGTFRAGVSYYVNGKTFESIALGDFNADGILDLGMGCGGGCVGIALGNGDGTFQPAVTYASGGIQSTSVAFADVNGDGKLDLLTANYYCSDCGYQWGTAGVLLGNGDGTFQPARSYGSIGTGATSIAAADVNGDGRPDLVVANYCQGSSDACSGNKTPGLVAVLLGNGDGTFQPAVAYNPGGVWTQGIAIADVNHDGKPDLLLANSCGVGCTGYNDEGSLTVLLGNGDGTFKPAVGLSTGGMGYALAVNDLNRDGRPDVAVGNIYGTVGILLNNVGPHDPTTTFLLSSPNPSAFGQVVTLSATVSSSSGTPTGTVTFFEGATQLGSATLENGSASFSIDSLGLGSHSIAAKYQGSLQFSVSGSNTIEQLVNVAATTTVLTSSRNPGGPNQAVTLYVHVSTGYDLSPTGHATFKDGANTIAMVALGYQGWAAYRTLLPRGLHAITAIYSGDTNDRGSTSAPLLQYIGYFPVKSVTVVTSSQLHSFLGQPVTFTATVAPIDPAYGRIADGEPVTFFDGKTMLGTVPLANGTASYTTSSLTAKSHSIKVIYPGDLLFKSSSGTVTQVVGKYLTTATLSSAPNPSAYGQAVTFTATVTSAGPIPTGKVKFMDGAKAIGSATLSDGVATLSTSKLVVGTHPMTAQYGGDAANDESTSTVLQQVVQ